MIGAWDVFDITVDGTKLTFNTPAWDANFTTELAKAIDAVKLRCAGTSRSRCCRATGRCKGERRVLAGARRRLADPARQHAADRGRGDRPGQRDHGRPAASVL